MSDASFGDPPADFLRPFLGRALDTPAVSAKLAQANLAAYITNARTLPTFIIAHGDNDCQVPFGQSQELADALARVGSVATLTILPGASHADGRFESTQSTPAVTRLGACLRPLTRPERVFGLDRGPLLLRS